MNERPKHISNFVRIVDELFQSEKLPPAARAFAPQVFARLQTPSDNGVRNAVRYPACEWLEPALDSIARENPTFATVAQLIRSLEPVVGWTRRTSGKNGSSNYIAGHVNGMICGPGGAESRDDIQLGFSLMMPNVRYPDHSHAPEEAYVLMTAGEFRQQNGEWFDPGVGGGIHNPPGGLHAMRSGDAPFLAIWCLLN
ncbi:dimethylsulfoniopropionate lyase [Burkholderia multivorans]|uniref:dimethylsulfoniopropionate lyase n=1 Tax=Burkholderia multivorans TaxID=87883 RepID=UPI00201919BB|nr:dimethylsulfoniopropionate lyase [Burkholderia multivorans]MCO1368632.1 dimethylsulfoniopropionate lyase [Burkholderia multivorans]MCO1380523.1 dimethylsulfoniopropionate lyase [Burkholderia multivorans]MDN8032413.1 dimethylsulfoniopropionate lyase [Burkholderia multivorans]UQP22049.1 dimethylsulfoniopropionate lyase [Burkholderia multivorans]UQP91503.1 dimethylsulfoniopropionate lyase [Burkholderia multivorans]